MMKKNILLFVFLIWLFMPRIYALSYDFDLSIINDSSKNQLQDIRVSLKNVKDSDFGVASCTFNITFSENVILNNAVRSLGSWTLTKGNFYLLDTGNGVKSNSDLLIIPVKVNGNGKVEVVDIECSDDRVSKKIENKSIDLKYSKPSVSSDNNSNNNIIKDSNCDLNNILLSEGNIDFDSSITEYYVDVEDADNLIVTPELVSDKAKFTVYNKENEIVIDVVAEDGSKKIYTIFVNNDMNEEEDIVVNSSEDKKSYDYVFVLIIGILLIINVVRIVINKRRK